MSIVENHIFLWLLMASAFFIITALFYIDNKELKKYLAGKIDPDSFDHISDFSWSRTTQILCCVALLFCIICFYDFKINELNSHIRNLEKINSINEIPALEEKIIKQEEITETAPVELLPYIPEGSIQDIFSGSDNDNETANKTYNIKSRYEELLVNYLLMDKCGKAENTDYEIITSTLQKEISHSGAEPYLEADILDAAKGSFDELYSDINCGDPFIENSSTQYRSFITSLSKKLKP